MASFSSTLTVLVGLTFAGFLTVLPTSESAKILGLFPYRGASHWFVYRPLLEELARRGHDLTVVSHFPRKEPLENYRDISIFSPEEVTTGYQDFKRFENSETNIFTNLAGPDYLRKGYERVFSNPQVLALANSSFDLVITEMFNSDVFFGLTYKIGAPVVGFTSCQLLTWHSDSMGVPNDLPYIPQVLSGYGPGMTFYERLANAFGTWLARAYYHFIVRSADQAMAEKYLGPLPDLADVAANTSILLVNSHFSLLGQRPLPPSVIEVGGINVPEPKPLPKDLQDIFNSSESVIYFSMGSSLKADSMPADKEQMFAKAFEKIGKTVLWKREKPIPTKSKNIITRSWLPQRDILANPKTELFISHCGLLGLTEAVISGVPVLCMPMFGDQPYNAKFVAESGIGLNVRYSTLTEDNVEAALREILGNKKYAERAKEVSAAFNDRPMSPLDTAVFWTEYLLRHGHGPFAAPHTGLNIWQRLGFDLAALVVAFISILVCSFSVLLKRILNFRKTVIKEKQS